MMEPRGVVFNLQRASFHDGPGIRTTVFLKGCPLRCPWCHNPEGMTAAPQISWSASRCLSCGACTGACPRPGGPLPAGGALGADGCLGCGRCVDVCPTGAREAVGRAMSAGEVLAEVWRDRLVFESSGGGVTFSGGEPLSQPRFLLACLDACRQAGLHTAVDTCGVAPREVVLAAAARADLLLWDLKHPDPERHEALTGASLAPVLANLEVVAALGRPVWLRVPLLPGINDDPASLAAAAAIAAALPLERVCVLPYHRTGAGKAPRFGVAVEPLPALPPERLAAALEAFAARGVTARIGG